MGDTGRVNVRVRSANDLLAVAEALEREAAARYRSLSARMARHGDVEMAAQFEELARMEDKHASQVSNHSLALFGHRPDVAKVKWETPPGFDEDEARGAELSAYQALAFAVRNEERSFAFYSYVSAEAERPEIRAMAEELAREELHHASLLRQYRRRAFRRNRPSPFQMPKTTDELRAMAQSWDAEAALAHASLADALDAVGEAEDAAIFRRLAAEETRSAVGAQATSAIKLRSAPDGLRILEEGFDRYATIAERADDEHLIAEAQRLASVSVGRLAMAGGARSNTLLSGGGS